MAAGFRIEGGSSTTNVPNVINNNLQVTLPGYSGVGVEYGSGLTAAPAIFSEVDNGSIIASREILSPEVDKDYRLRVAHDNMLDQEQFADTAQNTNKFTHAFTTLTATESTSGLLTNSGNITTTTTGMTFGTFAMFPVGGTQTVVCETSVAFSAQPNANTVIDFGMFQRGASTAFAPLDGVYFRMSSTGMQGVVVSNGGAETTTAVFPSALGAGTYTYTNNSFNRFLIQVNNVSVSFWINNYKYGEIPTPVGAAFPCLSRALPWSVRHAIVGGTAGAATQATIRDYKVYLRGPSYGDALGTVGNRVLGSYAGLSGGTMGQLVAGTVTSGTLVKPTAAVPVNTSLAANLPNSLGGRILEQLSSGLAANVDGIFASYTVPAGSATAQGRRLKVTGIKLSGFVSTVVVGGPANTEWYIAFGHTADSLATAESASFATGTTKAPRRVMLPELSTVMGAAAAAGSLLVQPAYVSLFDQPIYVNPGERIALVGNKTITTAITSGVLSFSYQFIYSWEQQSVSLLLKKATSLVTRSADVRQTLADDTIESCAFKYTLLVPVTNTYTDNFTGTAATLLTAHTPDSGGSWTAGTGSSGNAVLDGTGNVYDQFGNAPWFYWSQDPLSADYDVVVKVKVDVSGSQGHGCIARQSTSANTHYRVFWHGGVGDWLLYKNVAGTATQIGNFTGSAPTTEKTLTLRCTGSTITVLLDGTQIISVTDSAVSGAGRPGIFTNGTNSNCYSTQWQFIEQGTAEQRTAVLCCVTEGDDTLSSTATLSSTGVNATLAVTEDGDTLSSAAVLALQATLAKTEADDTLSSAAVLALQATLGVTEGDDTLSSTATLSSGITATLAVTEGDDTLSSAAVLAVQATLSVTEGNDTLSSASVIAIQATLAKTEDDDTLASTATLTASGGIAATLAVTLADDTLSSDSTITQPVLNGSVYTLNEKIRRDDEQAMRLIIEAFNKLAAQEI